MMTETLILILRQGRAQSSATLYGCIEWAMSLQGFQWYLLRLQWTPMLRREADDGS